jgi:hypothetical protein
MKKHIISLFGILPEFNSFGFHKFYVAVYQINYAPEKEMLHYLEVLRMT